MIVKYFIFNTKGSCKLKLNSATGSWCISTKNRTIRLFSVFPVNGDFTSINSYYAKLEASRCLLYWL